MKNHSQITLPSGTPFQQTVWKELLKIPKGTTITYKELAQRVGKPKAYRAVAMACGANPNPGPIPCHRVVGSNGSIGGYSGEGGVVAKRALLEAEGVKLT